jgi:hypothetical protein
MHAHILKEMVCEYIKNNLSVEARMHLTSLKEVIRLIDPLALEDMKQMVFDAVLRDLQLLHVEDYLREDAEQEYEDFDGSGSDTD